MSTLQKPGWIARLLLTLTTLALIAIGFFFLTVALAVGAVVALVVGVRLWWMLRKLKRAAPTAFMDTPAGNENVVDGEYRVIDHESSAPRLPAKQPPANP